MNGPSSTDYYGGDTPSGIWYQKLAIYISAVVEINRLNTHNIVF